MPASKWPSSAHTTWYRPLEVADGARSARPGTERSADCDFVAGLTLCSDFADPAGMNLYHTCTTYLRARFGDTERGASLVEYALLVALIAVVCIAAVTLLGGTAANKFNDVGSSLAN